MEIFNTVPCSVCGKSPILQGGLQSHRARLVCPNYKSSVFQHGNYSFENFNFPMGFTRWHYENWWTAEQVETKGIPLLIDAWNQIHNKEK